MEEREKKYMETILALKKPQPLSLGSELERQAILQPEHPALIFGERIISYEQFNRMANQYANFFAQQGLKKGDVVALLMENRPEYLIALSGLSKLGVIVSLITNVLRGERLSHAINVSEARAIILGHELISVFNSIENIIRLKSPGLIFVESEGGQVDIPANMQDLNPLIAVSADSNPDTTAKINSNDIVAYMSTAGSTGLRKLIPVLHKRWLLTGNQVAMVGEMTPETIQYMCLPLYYNPGLNVCFASMMVSGGSMVIKEKFSVSKFWDDIRRHRVNFFMSVGEMLRYLCESEEKPDDIDNPLETVMGNGTRGDVLLALRRRFGIKRIIEVYGTTEGIGAFINEGEIAGMCGNLSLHGMRQGEVIEYDHINDKIIRGEDGLAIRCKPGQSGLLIAEINELNEFSGYLNEPEATEARILKDIIFKGDRYFNTGDMVQLHEGDYISFIDRLGNTYRWKSKTVSADQVSDVINKFFGSIEESFVYGVKIPGMEGRCGMAALELIEDVPMDWKGFIEHINKRMPPHARPIFLRIFKRVDPFEFRIIKHKLQQEGFNPQRIKEPLYFLDPGKDAYVPLNLEIYDDIIQHRIRF